MGQATGGGLKAKANKSPSSSAPYEKPHLPLWLSLYVHSCLEPEKVKLLLSLCFPETLLLHQTEVCCPALGVPTALRTRERASVSDGCLYLWEGPAGPLGSLSKEEEREEEEEEDSCVLDLNGSQAPLGSRRAASKGSGRAVRGTPSLPYRGLCS